MFLDEVAELKRKVSEKKPDMAEILEMKRLLIRWLIQHIKHMDKAFGDYIKKAA